jgi:hypothetical protein
MTRYDPQEMEKLMSTINMQRQIKIHMEFCIPVICDSFLYMCQKALKERGF